MAQRRCSLCGWYYTDEDGHDRVECVERLKMRVAEAERELADARLALAEALGRLPRL